MIESKPEYGITVETSFVYGNWYCSKGHNPNKCPVIDNGDRIACINIEEVAPVVDDYYIENKSDKCSWLLKMTK